MRYSDLSIGLEMLEHSPIVKFIRHRKEKAEEKEREKKRTAEDAFENKVLGTLSSDIVSKERCLRKKELGPIIAAIEALDTALHSTEYTVNLDTVMDMPNDEYKSIYWLPYDSRYGYIEFECTNTSKGIIEQYQRKCDQLAKNKSCIDAIELTVYAEFEIGESIRVYVDAEIHASPEFKAAYQKLYSKMKAN